MPSIAESGQILVTLPVIIAGKVALYNAMLSESKRKIDMARMLNIHQRLLSSGVKGESSKLKWR